MTDLRPPSRSPRMDIVRSMLAERDNRSGRSGHASDRGRPSAEDRRRLWQKRLAEYVREPVRH